MPDDDQSIYEDHVLRHFDEPHGQTVLSNATHQARVDNPSCGDSVGVQLCVDSTGIIRQAAFTGRGCVISQAAASMLVEHLEGKPLESVVTFSAQQMLGLFQARLTPRRQQCCLLAWQALRACLSPTNGQS